MPSEEELDFGVYAGVAYRVFLKDGKKYIAPDPTYLGMFMQNGANLQLLDDIGDQDPEELMEQLFDSMSEG